MPTPLAQPAPQARTITTPAQVQWKRTVLACMADYIDAGSIVAASAGLALWSADFGLSKTALGVLGALGVNAGAYAVGSLIGGRLGDLLGRKRIYQWDLLVYVLGALLVIFTGATWMLFAGLIVMGLAVGADVPTSWALIGEIAPDRARGRLIGLTSVFWNVGPIFTLGLAFALSGFGTLGIRLVFAHLAAIALATWFLRRDMGESETWKLARNSPTALASTGIRQLFAAPYRPRLLLIFVVHTFGSISLGTFGFFLPYILKTTGQHSQAVSVGLNALYYGLTALGVGLLFIPLVDRRARRAMYGIAGFFATASTVMLIVAPLNNLTIAFAFIVVNALASACGQEQLYRVWCQELFPTMLRATAQGSVMFAQKTLLAVWSLFVPVIVASSFAAFTWILAAATAISVLVGFIFMPARPATIEDVS